MGKGLAKPHDENEQVKNVTQGLALGQILSSDLSNGTLT